MAGSLVEVAAHLFPIYMDEPPQALSPPPTASHVVQFSSHFSIAKLCSSCSWFVFVFVFWRECGVV